MLITIEYSCVQLCGSECAPTVWVWFEQLNRLNRTSSEWYSSEFTLNRCDDLTEVWISGGFSNNVVVNRCRHLFLYRFAIHAFPVSSTTSMPFVSCVIALRVGGKKWGLIPTLRMLPGSEVDFGPCRRRHMITTTTITSTTTKTVPATIPAAQKV